MTTCKRVLTPALTVFIFNDRDAQWQNPNLLTFPGLSSQSGLQDISSVLSKHAEQQADSLQLHCRNETVYLSRERLL